MCHLPWCKSFHHGQLQASEVASLNADLGKAETSWLMWAALQVSDTVRMRGESHPLQGHSGDFFTACSCPSTPTSATLECKINMYSPYEALNFKNSKLRFCLWFSVWVWMEVWATLFINHASIFFLLAEGNNCFTSQRLRTDLFLLFASVCATVNIVIYLQNTINIMLKKRFFSSFINLVYSSTLYKFPGWLVHF